MLFCLADPTPYQLLAVESDHFESTGQSLREVCQRSNPFSSRHNFTKGRRARKLRFRRTDNDCHEMLSPAGPALEVRLNPGFVAPKRTSSKAQQILQKMYHIIVAVKSADVRLLCLQYAALVSNLALKSKSVVRDLDPEVSALTLTSEQCALF